MRSIRKNSIFYFQFRVLAVSFVATILLFLMGLSLGDEGYLISALCFLPGIYVGAYQLYSRENDIFTPLNFLWVNLLFSVSLQAIYYFFVDQGENRLGLDNMSTVDTLFKGALIINVGVLCYLFGYAIKIKPKAVRADIQFVGYKKILLFFVILFCISIFLLIVYISVFNVNLESISAKRKIELGQGVNSAQGHLRLGATFSQIAFLIGYAYCLSIVKKGLKPQKLLKIFLPIMFLLGVIPPFLGSQRSAIIYFIISFVALRHYQYKRLTLGQLKIVFVLLISLLLVVGALRFANGRENPIQYYIDTNGVEKTLSTVFGSGNLLGLAKTGLVADGVPELMDYQYGKTYTLWVYLPIPRAYWADKPIIRIGGIVGPVLLGTVETSGGPPGFFGEAYINFGWFGIPIMSIFLGMFCRYFYESYGRTAYASNRCALIYCLLYTPICFSALSSDFSGLISRIIVVMVPLTIFLYLVSKKARYQGKNKVALQK